MRHRRSNAARLRAFLAPIPGWEPGEVEGGPLKPERPPVQESGAVDLSRLAGRNCARLDEDLGWQEREALMQKLHPGPGGMPGGWAAWLERWQNGGRERYEAHYAHIQQLVAAQGEG